MIHQFAPVDAPGAAARFLDHWRPGAALFVESELWPNLIVAAQARGVQLALVSARMTEASAARLGPRAGHRPRPAAGLRPDPAAGRRHRRRGWRGLGAATGPHLNLKLAGDAAAGGRATLVGALQAGVGGRKVVLAASTHPGEER